MTQTSGNLALDDMENELDKVIADMSDSTRPPVAEPPKSYPSFAPGSMADSLRGGAGVERPPFRPRPLSALDRKPIPPQPPVAVNAKDGGSEAERFLATGERLLDVQRRKIQTLESEYEIDRVRLIDDYRVKMRELEHQASDALRSFDIKYQGDKADATRILDALVAMRG